MLFNLEFCCTGYANLYTYMILGSDTFSEISVQFITCKHYSFRNLAKHLEQVRMKLKNCRHAVSLEQLYLEQNFNILFFSKKKKKCFIVFGDFYFKELLIWRYLGSILLLFIYLFLQIFGRLDCFL